MDSKTEKLQRSAASSVIAGVGSLVSIFPTANIPALPRVPRVPTHSFMEHSGIDYAFASVNHSLAEAYESKVSEEQE